MTETQPKAGKYAVKLAAGGTALMLAAHNAFAAPPAAPDVTDGESFLMSLLVPIGVLGSAFLIVSIAIKGWKIMRSL